MRQGSIAALVLTAGVLASQSFPWNVVSPLAEFHVAQVGGVTEFRNILKRQTSQGEDRSAEFVSPTPCVAIRAEATMNETAQNSNAELLLALEVFDVPSQTWVELVSAKRVSATPEENLAIGTFRDDGSLNGRRVRIRSSNPATMYYGIDAFCYPDLESIPDGE